MPLDVDKAEALFKKLVKEGDFGHAQDIAYGIGVSKKFTKEEKDNLRARLLLRWRLAVRDGLPIEESNAYKWYAFAVLGGQGAEARQKERDLDEEAENILGGMCPDCGLPPKPV